MTADAVVVGCEEGGALLDRTTGEVRWTTSHAVIAPAVDDDLVLVADSEREPGVVVALDRRSGDVRWTATGGRFDGAWTGYLDAVAIDAEHVYAFTHDGVTAVDRRTGAFAWRQRLDGHGEPGVQQVPAVRDGRVYVLQTRPNSPDPCCRDYESRVVAFDADTGLVDWSRPVGDADSTFAATTPVVGPDVVLLGESNHTDATGSEPASPESALLGLDPETGRRRFRTPVPAHFGQTMVADGDRVYVPCPARSVDEATEVVYAFSVVDGEVVWRTDVPATDHGLFGLGAPVADGLLAAGPYHKDLRAYR